MDKCTYSDCNKFMKTRDQFMRIRLKCAKLESKKITVVRGPSKKT